MESMKDMLTASVKDVRMDSQMDVLMANYLVGEMAYHLERTIRYLRFHCPTSERSKKDLMLYAKETCSATGKP